MMAKAFASADDTIETHPRFTEIGDGLYAFTAEGDPNSGVIIGDESVMIIEAQASPKLAQKVIDSVRSVTDKPISHLVLTHFHAVRTLGASAYGAQQVIMSDATRALVAERGEQDRKSEFVRFPRLFSGLDDIPDLTWPTTTFTEAMSVYLGKRKVDIFMPGRAHTSGDAVVWVPDAEVMFSGDIVQNRSACYCGDAHLSEWGTTLDVIESFNARALVPGRGDALTGDDIGKAIHATRDFIDTTYQSVAAVAAKGGSLKDAMAACRKACDPKFSDYAIYEHCLPFNVTRAYDEARGLDHPRIWTTERDAEMWATLQG